MDSDAISRLAEQLRSAEAELARISKAIVEETSVEGDRESVALEELVTHWIAANTRTIALRGELSALRYA